LPALALIVVASLWFPVVQSRFGLSPWLWAVPAGLLIVPALQLVPLPAAVAALFPAHAALNADLAAAGVDDRLHTWTLIPIATERVLMSAVVPAALFIGTVLLRRREQRWLLMGALAFAVGSAFLGFWQLLEGPGSDLYFYPITNRGEAVGLFANRNHLASLLAVMVPVAAGLLIDRVHYHHRNHLRDPYVWAYASATVVLAIGATATHSRAGLAMLMLSVLAAFAVPLAAGRRGSWASAQPWLQKTGLIAVIVIVQYTLYGLLLRLDADPLDDARWTVAQRTIAAARPYHALGAGLGTFTSAYYQLGEVTADLAPFVNHAHNDYLELWLEGGLPAMLLVAAALWLLGWRLWLSLQLMRERGRADAGEDTSGQLGGRHGPGRDEDLRYPGLTFGVALALVLLALHSAVDYPLRTLTLGSLCAVMAAVLATSSRRTQQRSAAAVAPASADLEPTQST